jgi:integron integrase
LLDRALDAALEEGLEQAGAKRYVAWMRDFILFHNKRHPQEMGMAEIQHFLGSQQFTGWQGPEKRAEAERALRFLYERVLGRKWPHRRHIKAGNAGAVTSSTARGSGEHGRVRFRGGQRQDVALAERMRQALRLAQHPITTEKIYVRWVERYVAFHRGRRAEEMGAAEVEQFLTHLATDREVAAGTQKQALSALVMLYETVLGKELGQLMPIRGHHGVRVPVVMSASEVPLVLKAVVGAEGRFRLMCELMYGSGARVRECCRVRVKDVDLERRQLVIRNGKGDADRVTVLPQRLVEPLRKQMEVVARWHKRDVELGFGRVWLPRALRRKYPNAERELGWQYLFPSHRLSVDPRDKAEGIKRRHHLHVDSLQRAVKDAVRVTGLTKQITPHTFRHSFATRLLETGSNIKQVQELLGHKDIRTTMIYLHVMESGTADVVSPLDMLEL